MAFSAILEENFKLFVYDVGFSRALPNVVPISIGA
jgi:hypothetical protein